MRCTTGANPPGLGYETPESLQTLKAEKELKDDLQKITKELHNIANELNQINKQLRRNK